MQSGVAFNVFIFFKKKNLKQEKNSIISFNREMIQLNYIMKMLLLIDLEMPIGQILQQKQISIIKM